MLAQPDCDETTFPPGTNEHLATLPILVLNVHSRCNCRCVMCDIWKVSGTAEVSADSLARHRESLRRLGVQWVVLTGGEPLMHSNLASLCTFFRDLNIRLSLLTTGLLLQRRAEEVAAFFDDVILSLDGPREIHDAIRRVKGAFQLLDCGIAAVRALRPEMRITARMTIQKLNHAHVMDTVLSAKKVGLDGISFLAADVTSQSFNRPLLWPGERQNAIALSADEIATLDREIDNLISWCVQERNSGYVAESPAKLSRIAQHFRAHLGLAPSDAPKCNAPWVSAVIDVDGSVRPCFFHRPIGSIHDQSLYEAINGDAALAFRRELDVASNDVCRQCVCSLYKAEPALNALSGHKSALV